VGLHLDDSEEAREQVAFADVLVLNKTDLVSVPDLEALERRLRGMNAFARLRRSHMAHVPLADVLGIGGFDLARALEYKPAFLEPEYPFEWGGVYALGAGAYELTLREGPDPSMGLALTPASAVEVDNIRGAAERILRIFAESPVEARPGDVLRPDSRNRELAVAVKGTKRFPVLVPESGNYLLFTQHRPEEFDLRLCDARGDRVEAASTHEFVAGHTHEDAVRSVSLEVEAALDPDLFRAWLGDLLREQGTTLYRMKGFLNFAGVQDRVVLQGVHMLVDHAVLGPWGDRARRTQLVLIGRDLDGEALQGGLSHCIA
jgi:G3E family GTPase